METKSSWILWLKIFGLLSLLLVGFAYLSTVTLIFYPLLCAIILNVLLSPVVAALERRGMTRANAVMMVFLAFAAVLTVMLILLPPYVAAEIEVLKLKWPEARVKLEELLTSAQNFINARVPEENKVHLVTEVPAKIRKTVEGFARDLPHLLAEGIVALLLIPVFTFFLLRDGRTLKKSLVAAVPNRYFEMTLNIFYKVNLQVSNYLRGLVLEATADAVIASLICLAFGIPNAIVIGLVVGATTVMPLVGIVISAVLCPLIAIFSATGDPFPIVAVVVGAIIVTHILDNVFVAPLIMGHSVHMHPALVIMSIILGGKLFGVLGIILAVPGVSILKVLIQEGYRGIKSNEYFLKLAQ